VLIYYLYHILGDITSMYLQIVKNR